jgi:hypothetical protein
MQVLRLFLQPVCGGYFPLNRGKAEEGADEVNGVEALPYL